MGARFPIGRTYIRQHLASYMITIHVLQTTAGNTGINEQISARSSKFPNLTESIYVKTK